MDVENIESHLQFPKIESTGINGRDSNIIRDARKCELFL